MIGNSCYSILILQESCADMLWNSLQEVICLFNSNVSDILANQLFFVMLQTAQLTTKICSQYKDMKINFTH